MVKGFAIQITIFVKSTQLGFANKSVCTRYQICQFSVNMTGFQYVQPNKFNSQDHSLLLARIRSHTLFKQLYSSVDKLRKRCRFNIYTGNEALIYTCKRCKNNNRRRNLEQICLKWSRWRKFKVLPISSKIPRAHVFCPRFRPNYSC